VVLRGIYDQCQPKRRLEIMARIDLLGGNQKWFPWGVFLLIDTGAGDADHRLGFVAVFLFRPINEVFCTRQANPGVLTQILVESGNILG